MSYTWPPWDLHLIPQTFLSREEILKRKKEKNENSMKTKRTHLVRR
jgi:hypothetical protein